MVSIATISGDTIGSADTSDNLEASGDLAAITTEFPGGAIDPNPAGTWSISTEPSSGTASVDENGMWEYEVDPDDPVFDGLDPGDTVDVTFTVLFDPDDGIADTQDVAVTVTYICFTNGTLIRTQDGEVPVEDLRAGDYVETLDHGSRKIIWAGANDFSNADIVSQEHLWPIKITLGALASPTQHSDLIVSPQHRILIRDPAAELLVCASEVLVAAHYLTNLDGVMRVAPQAGMSYHHILLDAHEIVFANGAEAETLFLGNEALYSVEPSQLVELETLFPKLPQKTGTAFGPPARRILFSYEASAIFAQETIDTI